MGEVVNLGVAPVRSVFGTSSDWIIPRPGCLHGNWPVEPRPNDVLRREGRRTSKIEETMLNEIMMCMLAKLFTD